jgi:hypothetical protein
MTLHDFKLTLSEATPPANMSVALQSLWQEGKGNWNAAHKLVQSCEGQATCDWVHAYLHRKEGDLSNAGYWYRRASKSMPDQSLAAEWEAITASLLAG